MNIIIINNIEFDSIEAILVQDIEMKKFGYITFNKELEFYIDYISKHLLNINVITNNIIKINNINVYNKILCNILNDYLPYPYKVVWINKSNENMNDILNESISLIKQGGNNE